MRRARLQIAAVIALGALLLGACSQKPDDNAITSDIQSKLFQDPVLKTRDIRVESQKGVVVLSGSVGTELEKGSAEHLASQASGVKQVINQLAVAAVAAAPSPEANSQAAEEPPPAPAARPRRVRSSHRNTAKRASTASDEPQQAAPPKEVAAAPAAAPAPAPPPPPPPERITVPAGTVVTVRMIDSIDSSQSHPGQEFAATVENAVVVGERVVIPHNADARVRLVNAKSAGRMTGTSSLQLELISLSAHGNTYSVESGYYALQGASRGKRTAETVGGGAGLGALIGAIAGHGKGAAIGAAIGAGAGTAAEAATHGQQVKVTPETKLDFTIRTPFTVTM